MQINPEITSRLEQFNIDPDAGLLYLLGVFFGVKTKDHISEEVAKQVNFSKIVTRDYDKDPPEVTWNIPLFQDGPGNDPVWDWVLEWRKPFMELKEGAGGDRRDCVSKMKKFFAANPDVRKEEVIAATEIYLQEFRYGPREKLKYLQQADYFISKAVKAEGTSSKRSRLDIYIEILRNRRKETGSGDDLKFKEGLVS